MDENSKKAKQSAAILILKALVPYTSQNLNLAYNPTRFFDELEGSSDFSRRTLIQSFARAKKKQLIGGDTAPILTSKGRQTVQPFIARQLRDGGELMVIFDIPEDSGSQRRQFRALLRYLGFSQIQRSVWISPNDHTHVVREAIEELGIGDWVQIYEASRIR
jgi:FPC/CPF motif-containing protein YcgG